VNIRRICILGGTGFVGHHLSSHLAAQGYACRVLTRHPQRHRDLQLLPGSDLVGGDIFQPDALRGHFTGCEAVINLVGILNQRAPRETFRRLHVELVEAIVEAGRRAGIRRYLHMSAVNADAANGKSEYLRSKGEGESRAHTLGQAAMKVTSFRPSVVFGPGDSFFNRFAGLLRLSPGFFPLACPDARFAPVYVGDVAAAFARSLDDPATFGQHYDLCGPRAFSLRDLVAYTADNIGRPTRILGLGDTASRLQARLLGLLPGKPFTLDNYLSLQTDSLCAENGLQALGISPRDIDAVVPLYLGGQAQRQRYQVLRRPP
jgi:NADH dehydrogenase